jgi:Tfp pilus assembly protein PilX
MKIKEKLLSGRGASLIIALVFMLFAAMVGSAVLAAATANGGRIASLKTDQQEYLNQRSAATLLSDELQMSNPSIVIQTNEIKTTTYTVGDGGVRTATGESTAQTVTFTVDGSIKTQLQRILFESAIMRYIEENELQDCYTQNIISGFTIPAAEGKDTTITSPSQFSIYSEQKGKNQSPTVTLTIDLSSTGTGNSEKLSSFEATVGCVGTAKKTSSDDSSNASSPYSFCVSFGEDSQLSLRMYASVSTPKSVTAQEQSQGSKANELKVIETTTTTQTISWDAPEILKGAAS